jgi:IS5 family transposase
MGPESQGIMKPKPQVSHADLFRSRLSKILILDHPLLILAENIDWASFDTQIEACYAAEVGRPGIATHVMVGLLYLKSAFDCSDVSLMEYWVDNPYWQAFCDFESMQHEPPIDPSSPSQWRKRVGAERLELQLKVVVETALKMKTVKPAELEQVNVDTTVQEKAIAFPTDTRLYHKMRLALLRRARQLGIRLRETFDKWAREALIMNVRYSHARQYQRAAKMRLKLKTYLGRVCRAIRKRAPEVDGQIEDARLRSLMQIADRIMTQTRTSKDKVYSVHEPEVVFPTKSRH